MAQLGQAHREVAEEPAAAARQQRPDRLFSLTEVLGVGGRQQILQARGNEADQRIPCPETSGATPGHLAGRGQGIELMRCEPRHARGQQVAFPDACGRDVAGQAAHRGHQRPPRRGDALPAGKEGAQPFGRDRFGGSSQQRRCPSSDALKNLGVDPLTVIAGRGEAAPADLSRRLATLEQVVHHPNPDPKSAGHVRTGERSVRPGEPSQQVAHRIGHGFQICERHLRRRNHPERVTQSGDVLHPGQDVHACYPHPERPSRVDQHFHELVGDLPGGQVVRCLEPNGPQQVGEVVGASDPTRLAPLQVGLHALDRFCRDDRA